MFTTAKVNQHMTLEELRNTLLATSTIQRFQYPNYCLFTIEQYYKTIDQVIKEESEGDITTWLQEADKLPNSIGQEAPRVLDPATNLQEDDKETKRAILKQRACDTYNGSNKDNTEILNKIHYYIDFAINKNWRQDVEEAKEHFRKTNPLQD